MFAPGCLALLILFGFLVLLPWFFAHLMVTALAKLGLSPEAALLALIGIFFGGAINIPIKRIERQVELLYPPFQLYGLGRLFPRFQEGWMTPWRQHARTCMVIAVNLGGCIIPLIIVVYEILRLLQYGSKAVLIAMAITTLNVVVCYRLARPIPQLGIAMPTLVPPLVAAIPSVLLLPDFAPPMAFVAGVLGPLIGADLLHLEDVKRLQTGVASIGGAGTFDGIVLSGMFAAVLA
jgi:uncharacterized membrane protein